VASVRIVHNSTLSFSYNLIERQYGNWCQMLGKTPYNCP
jgi:hypothetical protein